MNRTRKKMFVVIAAFPLCVLIGLSVTTIAKIGSGGIISGGLGQLSSPGR
ncbi:MAG: hypothetical protein Tsb009_28520 [Planctomycetaceae bacterium]